MPTRPKLSAEDRRQMVLAVLVRGESYRTVGERHGVSHALVHRMVKQAKEADHAAKIKESEAEREFWLTVKENG